MENLELKYVCIYANSLEAYIFYKNQWYYDNNQLPDTEEEIFDMNTWTIQKIDLVKEELKLMNNSNCDTIIKKVPIDQCKLVLKKLDNEQRTFEDYIESSIDVFCLIGRGQAIEEPKFELK